MESEKWVTTSPQITKYRVHCVHCILLSQQYLYYTLLKHIHYCQCSVEAKPNVSAKSVRSFKGISVQNVEKLVMRKIFYQKCA